jgi:hypothetical protein
MSESAIEAIIQSPAAGPARCYLPPGHASLDHVCGPALLNFEETIQHLPPQRGNGLKAAAAAVSRATPE